MTICLVRCPSPFLVDDRVFPPLGLMAVGAGLKRDGHDVVVYDGELEQLPLDYDYYGFAEVDVVNGHGDYYGFGPTSPEYPSAIGCMARIKQANPSARIVAGGPHVTLLYAQCVDDGWDSLVVGDGETAASVAFFGHRKVVCADSLQLDEYPIPDRTLVDVKSYRLSLQGRPAATVVASRGCPYSCGFCSKNHDKVRINSADRVIEEIEILRVCFGYDAIAFPEDIFILNKRRTIKVCEYLKQKDIIWRCLVRADLVLQYGREFIDMMTGSGCVGVSMGIESGSNKILANINKGETVEQMREAVSLLKSCGVVVKGFFIIGLPGENEQTLAETEEFLRDMQLDEAEIKIFHPYPASPISNNPDWSG